MIPSPLIAVPERFKLALAVDWVLFVPIAFIYLITMIETTGDLTANSVIAGQPAWGPVYLQRSRGGVLGDGLASGIAAIFNRLANTRFSQDNRMIQLTGVARRHVGR